MICRILFFFTLVSLLQASYNLTQAKLMVVMSKLAYADSNCLKTWTCNYCNNYTMESQQIISIQSDNLQAITGYLPQFDSFVVAFRGTDLNNSLSNVLTDINMSKKLFTLCQSCSVHRGFYKAYKKLKGTLFTNLNNLKNKLGDKPIYFGGHSLGGALAAIAALQYKIAFAKAAVQVYTYGEPRIGNKQFASYFNSQISEDYRIVYKNDIVPTVPLKISGYRHQGTEVHYTNSKMTHFDICFADKTGECSNSVSFPSVSQHLIAEYMKLLKLPDPKAETNQNHLASSLRHTLRYQK